MRVADVEFIKSTAEYLDKLDMEPICITRDGQEYAVLSKPTKTPFTDSLVGILKGADIESLEETVPLIDIRKRNEYDPCDVEVAISEIMEQRKEFAGAFKGENIKALIEEGRR